MTHRSDRIYLSPNEERCEPRNACIRKDRCARYLATIPASGAKMADHSIQIWCGDFISPADARKAIEAKPTRKIHPPIGGLI